ncbi:hypothetical protein U14_02075 [Candidatus Moduliflexus flocculans]|uniref:Uncharacterized protein n=1 Tax=Candidatus Moduliflexus flocculans TaxID=1499966 RepID=A0A0S6VTR6_9BACT|nr:hypothetical protein U14_02075 [Candidatus Moduliflexus flocculans]
MLRRHIPEMPLYSTISPSERMAMTPFLAYFLQSQYLINSFLDAISLWADV